MFIPAQSNSNFRVPDKLNISLISFDQINDKNNFDQNLEFITNYDAAFPGKLMPNVLDPSTHQPVGHKAILPALILAPVAATVIAGVAGYISQSVSNEAGLYQEKLSGNVQDDTFLKRTSDPINVLYSMSYCGFKVTRDVKISKTVTTNAFTLICGIAPTADGELFRVKPLVFKTSWAGAKIVGGGLLSWLVLYPHLFLSPDHKMNSQIDISFDGFFRGKDQTLQHMPMGAFSFKVSGYDISAHKTLDVGSKTIPSEASGFLVSAPLSYSSKPGDSSAGVTVTSTKAGNIDLTVTVTESDASNAKANILKIGQLVAQEAPQISMMITNQISK